MDFSGHKSRVIENPSEVLSVAVEEGLSWRVCFSFSHFPLTLTLLPLPRDILQTPPPRLNISLHLTTIYFPSNENELIFGPKVGWRESFNQGHNFGLCIGGEVEVSTHLRGSRGLF